MSSKKINLPDESLVNRIYVIRGQKVMIDRDLAKLYGVETKHLKEAVKRNRARFPEDFMFELTPIEFENWRSQFATSNSDKMGLRYAPFCFTEQGVAMLSSVLKSECAIEVNIRLIRLFVRLRQMAITHKDILLRLEELELKASQQGEDIQAIFAVLRELLGPPTGPRPKIGYRGSKSAD